RRLRQPEPDTGRELRLCRQVGFAKANFRILTKCRVGLAHRGCPFRIADQGLLAPRVGLGGGVPGPPVFVGLFARGGVGADPANTSSASNSLGNGHPRDARLTTGCARNGSPRSLPASASRCSGLRIGTSCDKSCTSRVAVACALAAVGPNAS